MREEVVVDLTKRRKALLDQARGLLGYKHPHAHVYADQECNLVLKIRSKNLTIHFNTQAELEAAMAQVPGRVIPAGPSLEGQEEEEAAALVPALEEQEGEE